MSLHTGFGFQKKQSYFLKTKKRMWFVVQQKKEFWSQPKLDVNLSLSHTNSETFTKRDNAKFPPIILSDSKKQNSCDPLYARAISGYFWSGDIRTKKESGQNNHNKHRFLERQYVGGPQRSWIHNTAESLRTQPGPWTVHWKIFLSGSWFCPFSSCPVHCSPWLLVLPLGYPFFSLSLLGHI